MRQRPVRAVWNRCPFQRSRRAMEYGYVGHSIAGAVAPATVGRCERRPNPVRTRRRRQRCSISNRWGEIPRRASESIRPTSAPQPSIRVTATVSSPTSVIRARSRLAPTACSDKPSHSNGNLVSSDSARMPPAADAVQDRVKQHRMQREPARVRLHLLWQCRLYEDLATMTPHRAEAAERRTVFVSARGQCRIDVGNVDRFRALRRPLFEFLVRG